MNVKNAKTYPILYIDKFN